MKTYDYKDEQKDVKGKVRKNWETGGYNSMNICLNIKKSHDANLL